MSSMNPVVLVSLPNLPYLLGTFDTTNFRHWWRSAPFPDDLQTIKKGFHIYGRTHLVIAQKIDGLWGIYRSKNYGIDWERVWLAAEGEVIYDLVLITFGWAIMNTSLGFYETVNAGTSWTSILILPTAPNAPAFTNIGGGDVLLCTDGRYIWRSIDIARSWSQVCDMQAVSHFGASYYNNTFYYSGLSKPCIAGACGRVLAAHGPFLVVSSDAGVTWARAAYWEEYSNSYARFHPPRTIIYDRLWPGSNIPKFVISQILVSSVEGPSSDDVRFLVRCDDLVPIEGESNLYSRVILTYTYLVSPALNQRNWIFKHLYQQYLSPGDGLQISSYDVAVTGADYNDKLTFSAQTTGTQPSLKYSIDGGETWIDINIGTIKVGDPEEGGNSGGSMTDDTFTKLTWVAPPCNNWGYYDYTELSRRQCQSYEIDMNTMNLREKILSIDAIAELGKQAEESIDVITSSRQIKPYSIDALASGRSSKLYRIDRIIEGQAADTVELDATCEQDVTITEFVDALAQGRVKKQYSIGLLLRRKRNSSYLCDAILVKDGLTETVQRMVAKSPQYLDLVDPGLPYYVYDSRTTTV